MKSGTISSQRKELRHLPPPRSRRSPNLVSYTSIIAGETLAAGSPRCLSSSLVPWSQLVCTFGLPPQALRRGSKDHLCPPDARHPGKGGEVLSIGTSGTPLTILAALATIRVVHSRGHTRRLTAAGQSHVR